MGKNPVGSPNARLKKGAAMRHHLTFFSYLSKKNWVRMKDDTQMKQLTSPCNHFVRGFANLFAPSTLRRGSKNYYFYLSEKQTSLPKCL